MNYLLDTHSFLWFITDDNALSLRAKTLIENPDNSIFLSIASIWEMAIKTSLGKLSIPSPFTEFIDSQMSENNFRLLEIKTDHVGIVSSLTFHHRDPFDRLLITQALHEKMPLISNEKLFDSYGVKREW
jgi:PIN domain nuclease of toxin-antitoxin system